MDRRNREKAETEGFAGTDATNQCLPKGIRVSDPKEAVEKNRTQTLPLAVFVHIDIPWLKGRGVSLDKEPCQFRPAGKPLNKLVGRNGNALSDRFFFCIR